MIKVKFNTNGDTKSIEISGHAEFDEYGKDIVCASVSTIFQLTIMGLEKLAEQYPEHVEVEGCKLKTD